MISLEEFKNEYKEFIELILEVEGVTDKTIDVEALLECSNEDEPREITLSSKNEYRTTIKATISLSYIHQPLRLNFSFKNGPSFHPKINTTIQQLLK